MKNILFTSTHVCRAVNRTVPAFFILFFVLQTASVHPGQTNPVEIFSMSPNIVRMTVQSSLHQQYGCAFPLTYRFTHSFASSSAIVKKKLGASGLWETLPQKYSGEHYNGIEAFRTDSAGSGLYVSVAFDPSSDTVYLQFTGTDNVPLSVQFHSFTKYYDNRKAAVTVTADDWADWSDDMWAPLIWMFRSRKLPMTAAVIADSSWCSQQTWKHVQKQVDSGYLEIASHSGTHPYVPYANLQKEVLGSYDNIVANVALPKRYTNGSKEYVYVWVAPYGQYDQSVDSILSFRPYIVPRLYYTGEDTIGHWNEKRKLFDPIGLTLEVGLPSWGGGTADTVFMKKAFDDAVATGGVYHLMWHPQVIFADRSKKYLNRHLDVISGRNDLWYVPLGELYLYRLLTIDHAPAVTAARGTTDAPGSIELLQNYPNPFNPATMITFTVPSSIQSASGVRTKLTVFDVMGRVAAVLVNDVRQPGTYRTEWSPANLSTGIYFYELRTENSSVTKKMLFQK